MSRQRHIREAKALAYLRTHRRASVLEIGAAAVHGEAWSRSRKTWRAKEQIGLSIAVTLTRDGSIKPTWGNRFELIA